MIKIPLPFLKKRSKIPEKIYQEEVITAGDIISPSSIEIGQNYFKIGERFGKTYFIFSYPRYLSTAWLSPVINLNFSMDVSFYLHPLESEKVLKQLRKKVTEIQAEITEREEKGLIRDPTIQIAYRDLEELRDRLQTAQERMVRFGLYVTIYGESEKELREIETTLRSILESRLIYIKPALYQQKEGFISCSPYGMDQLLVSTMMNTGTLSSVFPFVSFDLSSNEGILYGLNNHNMSLVLFDRFALENANATIFGVSGSGKSIKGEEPVLIKKDGKIQLAKIGPFVEKLIKKHGASRIDDELEGVINPEIEVYSFNKDFKGEWSKVSLAARKEAPNTFYKFITRSGRKITTTGDHNMLVLKNGRVIAAKSSEIKEGEYIPLPRNVSSNIKSPAFLNLLRLLRNSKYIYVKGAEDLIFKNYKKLKSAGVSNQSNDYLATYKRGIAIPIRFFWKILKCLEINPEDTRLTTLYLTNQKRKKKANIHFPINNDFLRLAGFITAEGNVYKNYVQISNLDKEILDSIKFSLKELTLPSYEQRTKRKGKERIEGILIKNRIFAEIVKNLGGDEDCQQKKVWPFLFNLEKTEMAQYLSAYFEGDGGVNVKNAAVFATSKSKRLISEIAYLFYYFGIVARVVKSEVRKKRFGKKRIYWVIKISGQENLKRFAESINFVSKQKQKQLLKIIKGKSNTNVDFIPGLQPIFKEIHELFSPQLHNWRQLADWKNGKKKPSPQELLKIINIIEEKIQYFKDSDATFRVLNELPKLATIINLGKNSEGLDKKLRRTLGASWRIMKNQKFKPLSQNALKAVNTINRSNYSLTELKERVHSGFKELDLPVKYYSRALEPHYLQKNTRYETLQRSARFVWQNYQDILTNKVPRVEEKLAQLKILANSDLFWDPIVKITEIENKKEKYVYDLTVDNEVFLAGQGGMFVHNSYAIKLEILRYLMLGVDCIIIDPENEYKFLADAVGGSFFNISLSSPHHLNPFDLPLPREDESPQDVLRSNIINLVGLLRIMLGGLSSEEDSIIDRALVETYAAKDITPETDTKFWGENTPIMSDLEEILSTMEGAESLVRRLQKFTRGVYAQFFNQPSNVNISNRFVVFGIRDMEDELRPMAMFIVLRYVWKTITSQLKKRILVVDEAWWLMKTEDGASFLFGTVKRGRKYWLGVTTVTQDTNDFMKSEYGQPIITNSALKLLMKQSPATIDIVKKTFDLTEEEKLLLLESPVGEGLFFAGTKHVAIRIMASYTEDQIITTSPEELLKIKQAKEELEGK